MQALSLQREFQVARSERFLGSLGALGRPVTSIPELHRSTAVSAGGNGALEVAIVERVILHFYGQPFVGGIVRGSPRHRPGLEDTVELEPQIVVQAPRVMFLYDESQTPGRRDPFLSARFRRFR